MLSKSITVIRLALGVFQYASMRFLPAMTWTGFGLPCQRDNGE
jgi:hypothetical protein